MITIKSISNYLLERFQIIPLMILVLTDLMVIKNITSGMIIPIQKFILSFLFIIAYLFHNRVADDQRDFNFDMEFYPERDLQKGILNFTLLKKISYIMIIIMLLISILFGNLSIIALMPLFVYTYFSKKDFFLADDFKIKNLFFYNFLNMIQLLFLQVFIYVSILNSFKIDRIIFLHILLVFILSIQVEIARKIKPIKSPGNEFYSDHLGMKGAIILWYFFGLLSIIVSIFIGDLLDISRLNIILFESQILIIYFLSGFVFLKYQTKKYENIFWFGLLIAYAGQNMILTYA
tara:strand:- start:330 stop:1202 length:873 start_codon:yes stop_codon:yes gene_type:complete